MGFTLAIGRPSLPQSQLRKIVLKHFGTTAAHVATAGRQFPMTARMDLQSAIEELLRDRSGTRLIGIVAPNPEPPPLAHILTGGHMPIDAGPLQYDDLDVGNTAPVRCLKNALWLSRDRDLPFAVTLAPSGRFGLGHGVQVEVAVLTGERGAQFSS
jgi:hypothetical protein